jgi:hypothetical protein
MSVTAIYVRKTTVVDTNEPVVSMQATPNPNPRLPPIHVTHPPGEVVLQPGIYRIVVPSPPPGATWKEPVPFTSMTAQSDATFTASTVDDPKNPWPDPPGKLVSELGMKMDDVRTFLQGQGDEDSVE